MLNTQLISGLLIDRDKIDCDSYLRKIDVYQQQGTDFEQIAGRVTEAAIEGKRKGREKLAEQLPERTEM